MTREDYKKNMDEYDNIISSTREKIRLIKKEYIQSNKNGFEIGDKVSVDSVGNSKIGYIVDFNIDYYNMRVIPKIRKAKKDGTMASIGEIYLWGNDKVTKINK